MVFDGDGVGNDGDVMIVMVNNGGDGYTTSDGDDGDDSGGVGRDDTLKQKQYHH